MLLIGTDEGIYRWTEGNSWPVFHSLQDRAVVALQSSGPGEVVAIDDDGLLWETTNNGLNWRNLSIPDGAGTPVSLAVGGTPATIVTATKPLTVYSRGVGTRLVEAKPFLTTVLESADSLSTLIRKPKPQVDSKSKSGSTAVANKPKRKLIGWTRLASPSVPGGKASPGLRLLTIGPSAWLASLEGTGLVRSTDSGKSWTKVSTQLAEVAAIRPIPGTEGGLVAATAGGVWFSSDSGQTWEERSQGLEATKAIRVVEVDPSDPKSMLAAANAQAGAASQGDALYESKDGGKTWTRIIRSFPETPRFDRVTDIRFDPAQTDNIAVAFASGELWMTRNGGGYWQPFARQIKAARALCPVG